MAYHVIEGNVVGKKEKIGIVCARFNEFIVSKLLGGAIDGLVRHGISEENIDVAWVPGAFEIPLICEKMVKTGKYDAVIALGTVIRGSTSHYDYVCNEVSKGVAQVGLQAGVPVMFGILTTENIEQAIERAGTKADTSEPACVNRKILSMNKRTSFPPSSRKFSAIVSPVRPTRIRAPGGSFI